jgi:hypothetical protein
LFTRCPQHPARAAPPKSVGAGNLKGWQSLSIVVTDLNRSMN